MGVAATALCLRPSDRDAGGEVRKSRSSVPPLCGLDQKRIIVLRRFYDVWFYPEILDGGGKLSVRVLAFELCEGGISWGIPLKL